MTYSLSNTLQIGGQTIAIISEVRTTARIGLAASAVICSKQPVYVLIRQGQDVQALEMSGATVPLFDVAVRCPAALDEFANAP